MKRVSFILPAWKASYLEEAIRSIVGQTASDWELVVVDDCSPEPLRQIVESGMRMREFSKPFRVAVPGGEIRLCVRFDRVHDKSSGVDYIMILRRDVE